MSRFEFARKVLDHQEAHIRQLARGMTDEVMAKYLDDILKAQSELTAANAEVATWMERAERLRERLDNHWSPETVTNPFGEGRG